VVTVAATVTVASASGLNEHTNFQRSWTAALTLFKVATNDNWTDVMLACLIAVSILLRNTIFAQLHVSPCKQQQ
jgi:hypothetical protein